MSTTTDIKTAVAASFSNKSCIFRIVTRNMLQRGADLPWVSVFPSEEQMLFPPLTYLQPTGRTQDIELDGHQCVIVEVVPTLA